MRSVLDVFQFDQPMSREWLEGLAKHLNEQEDRRCRRLGIPLRPEGERWQVIPDTEV